jgi:dCMP deaminase
MNQKFIDYYMRIADITAELSYAKRLQVGAVIVKEHKILATGYNGTPAGWDNDCEDVEWCSAGGWLDPEEIIEGWPYEGTYLDRDGNEMQNRYRLKTKPEVLHAESNALMKVAQSTESSEGSTLFCTHAPCIDCAKLIYQAGITKVYYRNAYRSVQGIEFLEKGKIDVTRY